MATIIGKGIAVRGTLKGEEDIEIHGIVYGRIETTGAVIIAVGGRAHADISAGRVEVLGEVRSNVLLADTVDIQRGAVVEADVRAPRLTLADGARIRGHIDTASEREELIDAVLSELGSSSMQVYAEPKWAKNSAGA